MKKTIWMTLLALTMAGCLAMFGCSSEGASEGGEAGGEEAAEVVESDYEVTIDDTKVVQDYEGNDALVVTYSWVNNSDEATSAAVALMANAFQNGVELEYAVVLEGADTDGEMKEVKPGAGTTYDCCYLLEDDSDVTIEVSEAFSWDDVLLAEETVSIK